MPSLSSLLSLLSYGNLPRFLLLAITATRLAAALVAVSAAVTLCFSLPDLSTLMERERALKGKVREGGERGKAEEREHGEQGGLDNGILKVVDRETALNCSEGGVAEKERIGEIPKKARWMVVSIAAMA